MVWSICGSGRMRELLRVKRVATSASTKKRSVATKTKEAPKTSLFVPSEPHRCMKKEATRKTLMQAMKMAAHRNSRDAKGGDGERQEANPHHKIAGGRGVVRGVRWRGDGTGCVRG